MLHVVNLHGGDSLAAGPLGQVQQQLDGRTWVTKGIFAHSFPLTPGASVSERFAAYVTENLADNPGFVLTRQIRHGGGGLMAETEGPSPKGGREWNRLVALPRTGRLLMIVLIAPAQEQQAMASLFESITESLRANL